MRKPEHRPRPEAKSQLSARPSLSATPNPDTMHARHWGLTIPRGFAYLPGVKAAGPWEEEMSGSASPASPPGRAQCFGPAPGGSPAAHLARGRAQLHPRAKTSEATVGRHLVHRHPGAHGCSLAGTMQCSGELVLLATLWLKTISLDFATHLYFVQSQF